MKELVSKGKRFMLIKLHTNKPYNREPFKLTIKKIWRPTNAVQFSELEVSVIMVVFDNIKDKERLLRDSP